MRRVLVVEDNPADMELAAYLLEAYGYEVLTAPDVRQGLAAARGEPLALIICDLGLPHQDGHDLIRTLEDDPQLRATPVLAVSRLGTEGDRDRLLEAGFAGCLGKPIAPDEFMRSLEALLPRGPRPTDVQQ